jgi:hypothetical protein
MTLSSQRSQQNLVAGIPLALTLAIAALSILDIKTPFDAIFMKKTAYDAYWERNDGFCAVEGSFKESDVVASFIWEIGTLDQIEEYLGCSDLGAMGDLSLYSDNDWQLLYETYEKAIGDGYAFSLDISSWKDGFQVSYETKRNEWGRGIYAKEDIPQNTTVYKCFNTVVFYEPAHYRSFLKMLPIRRACEAIQWAYTETLDEKEQEIEDSSFDTVVSLDLDNGAIMNHAGNEPNLIIMVDNIADDANYDCVIYAQRRIKAGEEFLIDYSTFTMDDEDDFSM